MEWLLKFAEKSEDEKVKIAFHSFKFFIVSLSSFLIYKSLFGDFIIQEFTIKNTIDFVNSKYLFYSAFSFGSSWLIYFVFNRLQRTIALILSVRIKQLLDKNLDNEFRYHRIKSIIKNSKKLLRYGVLKSKIQRIVLPKQFVLAKYIYDESQEEKNESEKTYYILSTVFLFLGCEVLNYTGQIFIFYFILILSFISFIIAMIFSFFLRNSSMILAIIQFFRNFTDRYEYNRDN